MHSITSISRCPDVTFYPNGRIDITSRVAKLIGLEAGDVIDILADGKEYYLSIRFKHTRVVGKHKGIVYTSKGSSRNFRTYHKQMTDTMLATQGEGYNDVLRIAAGNVIENPQHGKIITLLYKLKL